MPRIVVVAIVAVVVLAGMLVYSQTRVEPLRVSGFLEADEIRIGSRVGGRVAEVEAQEGMRVEKGKVLVKLAPFDLLERRAQAAAELAARKADLARLTTGYRAEEIAQAEARHAQLAARLEKLTNGSRQQDIDAGRSRLTLAKATLDLANQNYGRTKSLFDKNVRTKDEMDRATEERTVAEATVAVREAELNLLVEGTRKEEKAEAAAQVREAQEAWEMAKKGFREEEKAAASAAAEAAEAALRVIDRQIEELTIVAPVNGSIEAVDLQPGDLVGAGAPVLSMLDSSKIWVRAYVPENRMNIKLEQKVQIALDSFPGVRFAGHISFIARQAEFTPGNVQTPEERSKQVFRIKVQLDEKLDKVRPGMSADVWLE
jgi:HlyD family secretion protein